DDGVSGAVHLRAIEQGEAGRIEEDRGGGVRDGGLPAIPPPHPRDALLLDEEGRRARAAGASSSPSPRVHRPAIETASHLPPPRGRQVIDEPRLHKRNTWVGGRTRVASTA